ncbi:MAG: hypothetical protein V1746_08550 [bacterium]
MKGDGLKGGYLTRRERKLLAKGIASLARKFSRQQDGRPDAHVLQQILRFLRTNNPQEKGRLAFFFKGHQIKLARQAKAAVGAPFLKQEKSSTKNKGKPAQDALASYNDDVSEMFKDALGAEGLSDEEIFEWLRCINGNPELKEELWEIFSVVGQDKELFRVLGHELLQSRGDLRHQDQIGEFLKIADEENEQGSREVRLVNFLCGGGAARQAGGGKGFRLEEQMNSNEKAEGKDQSMANDAQWQHELINRDTASEEEAV